MFVSILSILFSGLAVFSILFTFSVGLLFMLYVLGGYGIPQALEKRIYTSLFSKGGKLPADTKNPPKNN